MTKSKSKLSRDIDNALQDSFPASDPPSWTMGTEPDRSESERKHSSSPAAAGRPDTKALAASDSLKGKTIADLTDISVQAGRRLMHHSV